MIRFEDVSEPKDSAKKTKADPKTDAQPAPATAAGPDEDAGLPLGDTPAAAPAKKTRAVRKPKKA